MEVLNVTRIYRGDTYILYPYFKKTGNLILVNSNNGKLLGKCIGCLYEGTGSEYGLLNVRYVFLLNGIKSNYAHDFLFDYKKALVLVENTSKKVIRIKTKSNNEQKIPPHCIFFDDNIIRMLLFNCLPKLCIENYIDIITMIVGFGRVNRLWYEASKEIKAKVISCLELKLESWLPSYGIETFRLTPEVGKLYIFMFAEYRVMNQYKQGKNNRYFGMKNTMRYVGMFISHEQTGYRDNAEHTYTFQKGDEIINIRLDYYGRSCFNLIEEYNIDEDPCEIICTSSKKNNQKSSLR